MAVIDRLAAGLERQYRIERELGAGGMAIVFLAKDIRHDRRVAHYTVTTYRCNRCGFLESYARTPAK